MDGQDNYATGHSRRNGKRGGKLRKHAQGGVARKPTAFQPTVLRRGQVFAGSLSPQAYSRFHLRAG